MKTNQYVYNEFSVYSQIEIASQELPLSLVQYVVIFLTRPRSVSPIQLHGQTTEDS